MHGLVLSVFITILALIGGVFSLNAASAATYYVATKGTDSNAGSQSAPFRTIAKGLSVVGAGDTLKIRGGTYNEGIDGNKQKLPSGTSGNPVIIQAYPSETVILQPSNGTVIHLVPTSQNPTVDYLVFDGIILDGSLQSSSSFVGYGIELNGARFITFQNGEIRNFQNANSIGVHSSCSNAFSRCQSNTTFRNMKIHDIANNLSIQDNTVGHGIYAAFVNSLIENCQIYNVKGFGIQFYSSSGGVNNNTFRNNIIHDVGQGNVSSVTGLYIGSGDNNLAYNNIIYNTPGSGIAISSGASNSKVYNNTVYNNGQGGIGVFNSFGADVRNNIMYANGSAYGDYHDEGSSTTASNNLTSNPLFVNAGSANFQLQSNSPAIDKGMRISIVTSDFNRVPRPQGAAYDIGACEFGQLINPSIPTPSSLRIVAR
jgi:hypothetical protein